MGQINDYMCLDGTIPVSKLPFVLKRISEMSKEFGLDVGNVFHAGDGNMHPLILYNANKPGDLETCLLYTSPSPRDKRQYRMPSSA